MRPDRSGSLGTPRLGLEEVLEADIRGARFMLDIKGRRSSTARLVAELLHQRSHGDLLVCGRWWPSVETIAEVPLKQAVLSARNLNELSRLRSRVAQGPPSTACPCTGRC